MMLWWGQNTSEPDNTAVIEVLREQIERLTSQLENANREKTKVLEILEKQTLMLSHRKRNGAGSATSG